MKAEDRDREVGTLLIKELISIDILRSYYSRTSEDAIIMWKYQNRRGRGRGVV